MPITYLASYQIGRVRPNREYRIQEFYEAAKLNKKSVPEIKGIEVRFNGYITRHGNIVDGPTPEQMREVCEFIEMGEFKPAFYHLSNFGLRALLGNHRGRKVDEDILNTFEKFIGHYKEHESLFGQSMRERELACFNKSSRKPRHIFKKYVQSILDGSMPPNPQDNLFVENGYFSRNSITEVYHYAKRFGLRTTMDTGHTIRELFDPVPRENDIPTPESDLHKFLRPNNTFKNNYIEDIGSLAEHIHFHGTKKVYDPKLNMYRIKDHEEYNKENLKTFNAVESSFIMGLTEKLLNSAKNAPTCTIELEKSVNTAKNIGATMDILAVTFGPRFEPA